MSTYCPGGAGGIHAVLSEWLDTHAAPGERSVRHGQMMLSHNNEDLSAGSSRIRARRDHRVERRYKRSKRVTGLGVLKSKLVTAAKSKDQSGLNKCRSQGFDL